MTEELLETGAGAILYDAQRVSQPSADWFTASFWRDADRLLSTRGGRGSALVVRPPDAGDEGARWVLRHYLRGGAVARLLGDRYLYTGRDQTRAFHEFRVMRRLREASLPVPEPLLAHYRRSGPWYRADLITGFIDGSETLSERAARAATSVPWARVGQCIGRFHANGLCHADLNAHNILLHDDQVSLIDFDRARFREPGAWREGNLDRLKRSLLKVRALGGTQEDRQPEWEALLGGYWQSGSAKAVQTDLR